MSARASLRASVGNAGVVFWGYGDLNGDVGISHFCISILASLPRLCAYGEVFFEWRFARRIRTAIAPLVINMLVCKSKFADDEF